MDIIKVLLGFHIVCGVLSLGVAPVAISAQKGGLLHRVSGLVFTYAMAIAGITSLAIPILQKIWGIKDNTFLFLVGVFTLYMVFTGNRVLRLKKAATYRSLVKWYDWAMVGAMTLFGTTLLVIGIRNLVFGNTFGWVLVVFGLISLRFVWVDVRYFTGRIASPMAWLDTHIGRMMGATIATYTAFLVVNNAYFLGLPDVFVWLLPTALGVPLIVYFIRKSHRGLRIQQRR
jgi:uncharacterized membrane protein